MIISVRAAVLALGLSALCLSTSAVACGVRTKAMSAGWQARKDRALKIDGTYREVSRSTLSDRSAKDGREVVVRGAVTRPNGQVLATVWHREYPDLIILCGSGRMPEDGKSGRIFVERRDGEDNNVIDFEEKRGR